MSSQTINREENPIENENILSLQFEMLKFAPKRDE